MLCSLLLQEQLKVRCQPVTCTVTGLNSLRIQPLPLSHHKCDQWDRETEVGGDFSASTKPFGSINVLIPAGMAWKLHERYPQWCDGTLSPFSESGTKPFPRECTLPASACSFYLAVVSLKVCPTFKGFGRLTIKGWRAVGEPWLWSWVWSGLRWFRLVSQIRWALGRNFRWLLRNLCKANKSF